MKIGLRHTHTVEDFVFLLADLEQYSFEVFYFQLVLGIDFLLLGVSYLLLLLSQLVQLDYFLDRRMVSNLPCRIGNIVFLLRVAIHVSEDACNSRPNILSVLLLRTHLPVLKVIAFLVNALSRNILITVLIEDRVGGGVIGVENLLAGDLKVLLHLNREAYSLLVLFSNKLLILLLRLELSDLRRASRIQVHLVLLQVELRIFYCQLYFLDELI